MRDIVERAMRGDDEAFGVLVKLTSDRMYAIATRILRNADLRPGRGSIRTAPSTMADRPSTTA